MIPQKVANLVVALRIRVHQLAWETLTKKILPICKIDIDSPNEETGFKVLVACLSYLHKKQKEFG